jgi:oxygen-independent coproporphyrinogen-3 oxidase
MAGIYLHIPFCKQACHYCDFYFSTNRTGQTEVIDSISRELVLQKEYLGGEPINTIYFGGGTPSLLTQKELSKIFTSIKSNYTIEKGAEVTLEVNPDDINSQNLDSFLNAGINRLSIGIQTFQDSTLRFLNRAHDAAASIQSFRDARSAGFTNLSIDLIYSIPGQTDEAWSANIRQALDLDPEHISAYALTIEEKTVFGHRAARGKLTPASEDTSAHQFELLMEELQRGGYDHYEISNFCRPGFYSRHNSNYWKDEKYLGVGPSAHSYNRQSRQANVSNNALYSSSIQVDKIPFQLELLTREDQINEYLLTTLRTSWGCDFNVLQHRYGYDLASEQQNYLDDLYVRGLAVHEDRIMKLTKQGKLMADKIASDLFVIQS